MIVVTIILNPWAPSVTKRAPWAVIHQRSRYNDIMTYCCLPLHELEMKNMNFIRRTEPQLWIAINRNRKCSIRQGLGKVSSSTRPPPLPLFPPSPPLPLSPLPFPSSTYPLPVLPLLLLVSFPSPSFFAFPGPSYPKQLERLGSAVSSPVGSRTKPQPKNDLVHIWAKNSSSGDNS